MSELFDGGFYDGYLWSGRLRSCLLYLLPGSLEYWVMQSEKMRVACCDDDGGKWERATATVAFVNSTVASAKSTGSSAKSNFATLQVGVVVYFLLCKYVVFAREMTTYMSPPVVSTL